MAEPGDGMDALRARVERRSRSVPPPRRPRDTPPAAAEADGTEHDSPGPAGGDEARPTEAGGGEGERRFVVAAEDPDPPGPSQPEPAGPEPPELVVDHRPSLAADRSPMPAVPPTATGGGDEPTANLTLRVRQSLDFRLSELVHELRREGVRSSKKELIEMCVSELPAAPTEQLRSRLRAYRAQLPRDL